MNKNYSNKKGKEKEGVKEEGGKTEVLRDCYMNAPTVFSTVKPKSHCEWSRVQVIVGRHLRASLIGWNETPTNLGITNQHNTRLGSQALVMDASTGVFLTR